MTDQLSAPDSLPTGSSKYFNVKMGLIAEFEQGIPPKRGRIMESAETISSKPESEQSKTPLKMSRISPPTTKKPASKASAPPDDKTLKSMNEILKDRSAECKPRKVSKLKRAGYLDAELLTLGRYQLRYLKNRT